MKTFLKKIIFFFVFLGLLSGFIYFAGQKGVFNVRSIQVFAKEDANNRRSTGQTIGQPSAQHIDESIGSVSSSASFLLLKPRVEAKLAGFVGQPIWSVDIDKIIESVRSEQWIREVQIRRSVLGEVKVWIEPREVAAVLANRQGTIHSIALDGSLLSTVDGQDIPDVPFFTGKDLLESKKVRKQAVSILELLPKQGDLSRDTVSEVFYSEDDGFTLVLASDGATVILGQRSSSKKVSQVNEVLNYLRINSIPVRSIDSRLNSKILVKRKMR